MSYVPQGEMNQSNINYVRIYAPRTETKEIKYTALQIKSQEDTRELKALEGYLYEVTTDVKKTITLSDGTVIPKPEVNLFLEAKGNRYKVQLSLQDFATTGLLNKLSSLKKIEVVKIMPYLNNRDGKKYVNISVRHNGEKIEGWGFAMDEAPTREVLKKKDGTLAGYDWTEANKFWAEQATELNKKLSPVPNYNIVQVTEKEEGLEEVNVDEIIDHLEVKTDKGEIKMPF